jgi:hypothetical protein
MDSHRKKSLLIFGGIALLFIVLAFIAFEITGPMGIEERFQHAVGLGNESVEEEEGGGFFGFFVEGNFLGYIVILVILVAVAICLWLRSKKPKNAS